MFIGSGPRLPDGKAAPSGVHGGQRTFSPQAAHRPISAALSVGQLGEYRLDVQDFSLRVLWAKGDKPNLDKSRADLIYTNIGPYA